MRRAAQSMEASVVNEVSAVTVSSYFASVDHYIITKLNIGVTSFSPDLVSCSHSGVTYQPGETVRHEKEQCQDCKCGTGGNVRCEPSASCPKPAWIAELGGKDCIPLYSGDNCCPSDYLCSMCCLFFLIFPLLKVAES